jgi:3-oxoadipate enol-lactonase
LLSPGPAPTTIAGHAEDIVRLLDALQLDSVHVAGVSFGGLVGLTLAARAPARVRSLIAISTTDRVTPDMAARGVPFRAAVQEAMRGGDRSRVLELAAESTYSPEYRARNAPLLAARRRAVALLPSAWFSGVDQLLASLDDLDLTLLLGDITCPTLIVGGEADATFPAAHSRALATAIRGARLVLVPQGSHGLVLEHPAHVAALIVNFVGETEANVGSVAREPTIRR